MSTTTQPKVILFDMGGVCTQSPFQVVLDYELSSGIIPGWVNYAISKSAPNGSWHRLERGEIPLDKSFFQGFNQDLRSRENWEAFYRRESAKNPTLSAAEIPPIPSVDGESLFNEMMTHSHSPDPWISPALASLKASKRYILAALSNTIIFPLGHKLHDEFYFGNSLRRVFDVFISSAHVGVRKPEPRMYQLAVEKINEFANVSHGGTTIAPRDIVFLDDIGENLREARKQGFRTIKVPLGRAYEAVEELEAITGLKLQGSHPKIAIIPNFSNPKAKI